VKDNENNAHMRHIHGNHFYIYLHSKKYLRFIITLAFIKIIINILICKEPFDVNGKYLFENDKMKN